MWFESLLVFILFKFKKHPNISRIRVVNLDWFFSSKHQNNCSNISRLKQLGFTWFSINHFLEKSVRLKSDHQDLLRSVCFQKLYFHCSSAEEWSSSHIFWGAFISSSLNQHCIICLDHFNLSLLRHIIGDIERWLIFRSFYVSICYTVTMKKKKY